MTDPNMFCFTILLIYASLHARSGIIAAVVSRKGAVDDLLNHLTKGQIKKTPRWHEKLSYKKNSQRMNNSPLPQDSSS